MGVYRLFFLFLHFLLLLVLSVSVLSEFIFQFVHFGLHLEAFLKPLVIDHSWLKAEQPYFHGGSGQMQSAQTSGPQLRGVQQGLTGPQSSSVEGPTYSFPSFFCFIQKYVSATTVGAQEIFEFIY